MSAPSAFVVDGRCSECGRVSPTWTPETICEAIRQWKERTGHSPTSVEWDRAGPGHPNRLTVQRIFGSWRRGLQAAGLRVETFRHAYWTRKRIGDAFVEWRVKHGRWPSTRDWVRGAHDHPATATVYTKFRSWDAALDAAGRVVPGAANGQAWPE